MVPALRLIPLAGVAILGFGVFVNGAGSAEAAGRSGHRSGAPPALRVSRFDRQVLRTSDSVKPQARERMLRARIDLLDQRAREGVPLDARAVTVLTDPTQSVVAAAANTDIIDGIDLAVADTSSGTHLVQGVVARSHESQATGGVASSPAIGFAGVPTATGFRLKANGGVTVTSAMDPDINLCAGDYYPTCHTQYVRSEYWKYELPESLESRSFTPSNRSGSDYWAYARRGIADAQGGGYRLVDLTVRSRPWAGYEGRFIDVINYGPVGTSSACTSSGQIGFSYGGASIQIPLSNCKSVSGVSSTAKAMEFGADWNGRAGSQQAVEAVQTVRTREGQTPVWADYIWASFTTAPLQLWNYSNVKWTDPGW